MNFLSRLLLLLGLLWGACEPVERDLPFFPGAFQSKFEIRTVQTRDSGQVFLKYGYLRAYTREAAARQRGPDSPVWELQPSRAVAQVSLAEQAEDWWIVADRKWVNENNQLEVSWSEPVRATHRPIEGVFQEHQITLPLQQQRADSFYVERIEFDLQNRDQTTMLRLIIAQPGSPPWSYEVWEREIPPGQYPFVYEGERFAFSFRQWQEGPSDIRVGFRDQGGGYRFTQVNTYFAQTLPQHNPGLPDQITFETYFYRITLQGRWHQVAPE